MKDADETIPFGKYRLVRRLGAGGMAEAFLAKTEGPGGFEKTLVIKKMLPHLADDESFVAMFRREAKVAAMLTHTNVVQIYELGEIDGAHFIAMEYVDGAALHRLARASWNRGKSIPLEAICCAVADAALGLAAAHELCGPDGTPLGVVHRDVSPDNLMMNREGITKLLDFGVAKLADAERTRTGEVKGKIPFLSPEYIDGAVVDARSDLYALGVTFYWLVTGRRPFTGKGDHAVMEAILKEAPPPPRRLNPHVPDVIDELILRLLAKNPKHRPQSGVEVHDALAAALPTRRGVVVPFVHEALGAELPKGTGDAVASVAAAAPQTDTLKSWARTNTAITFAPQSTTQLSVPPDTAPMSDATAVVPFAAMPATLLDSAPQAEPQRRSFAPLFAGAAAVVLGTIAIAVVVVRERTQPPAIEANPIVVQQQQAPSEEPPSVAEPEQPPEEPTEAKQEEEPAPIESPAPKPPPVVEPRSTPRRSARVEEKMSIDARAPAGITWLVGGRSAGSGNAKLIAAAGTTSVVAIDRRRDGRSIVPVEDGVANYNALPHGKINPRAGPYAEVFLGADSLGTTPFAPVEVPVGRYTLRFVYKGKEQRRTVDVKANELARVMVDFLP